MAVKRTDKVNELIRTHLATLITREIEFPKGTVIAVTRVATASDLGHATAYIGVFPDTHKKTVLGTLKKHLPHLQHLLNQLLSMYAVPRLRVLPEEAGEEKTAQEELEIEKLFDQIHNE